MLVVWLLALLHVFRSVATCGGRMFACLVFHFLICSIWFVPNAAFRVEGHANRQCKHWSMRRSEGHIWFSYVHKLWDVSTYIHSLTRYSTWNSRTSITKEPYNHIGGLGGQSADHHPPWMGKSFRFVSFVRAGARSLSCYFGRKVSADGTYSFIPPQDVSSLVLLWLCCERCPREFSKRRFRGVFPREPSKKLPSGMSKKVFHEAFLREVRKQQNTGYIPQENRLRDICSIDFQESFSG